MSILKNTSDFSQVTATNEPQIATVLTNDNEKIVISIDRNNAKNQSEAEAEINEPTPFYSETQEAEPYPIDAFPESLKGVIEYIQARIECDIAMVASAKLGALSLAFQHLYTINYKLKDYQFENQNLSLGIIIVAESSERKSTLFDDVFKPFKEYEEKATTKNNKEREEIMQSLSDWLHKDKQYQSVIDNLNKALLKETNSDKEDKLLKQIEKAQLNIDKWQKEQPKPIIPPINHIMVGGDTTVEAYQRKFINNTPYTGIITSEAAMLLNGYSMNKENAYASLARLCELKDNGIVEIMRVKDNQEIRLYNRASMFCLSIQNEVIKDFINNGKALLQGFLPRCFLIVGKKTAGTRFQNTLSKEILDKLNIKYYLPFKNRISYILNKGYRHKHDDVLQLERELLTFTEDAENHLWQFYCETETGQQKGGIYSGYNSFASKAPNKVAQLASLFCLYQDKHFVDADDVKRAIIIVKWYLAETTRILDGKSDNGQPPLNTEKGLAENLRRYLFEKVFVNGNQNFNLRDLQNTLKNHTIASKIKDITIKYANNEITMIADKYRHLINSYLVENEWLLKSEDNKNYTVNPKALNFKG